jgi:methylglutaconyl-CoA hydratase
MSDLQITQDGPIARVILNRPEVHNAFNASLIAELTDTYRTLSGEPSVRIIVLSGNGKSFCAGADLEWMKKMASYTHSENLADAWLLQKLFETMDQSPKLTVAAVNGNAFGGGVGLIATCDFAIAAPTARFGLTEVKLGLIPAVISPYVQRKIGPGSLRALAVTGTLFNGELAQRIGLVDVLTEDFEKELGLIVPSFLEAGPEAVAATKQLLRRVAVTTITEAAPLTVEAIANARASAEGQEGIHAFLEKRKPVWKRDS